jgi:hypothetical protein
MNIVSNGVSGVNGKVRERYDEGRLIEPPLPQDVIDRVLAEANRAGVSLVLDTPDQGETYTAFRAVDAERIKCRQSQFATYEEWRAWLDKYGEAAKEASYGSRKARQQVNSIDLRVEVLYRHCGRCFVCGIEEWRYRARLHIHRVTPGSAGGQYVRENVIPVCRACHEQVEGLSWDEVSPLRHPLTVEGSQQ